jgi:Ner family transcriptional regulator
MVIFNSINYKDLKMINYEKGQDWHRADIRAELEKRGTSLRKLSREAGLSENTLRNALDRKWPKGEKIISEAIGVTPETIWPSRYKK